MYNSKNFTIATLLVVSRLPRLLDLAKYWHFAIQHI